MHRLIRDQLEEVLSAPNTIESDDESAKAKFNPWRAHLAGCAECRSEIAAMREQAAMLCEMRADMEPRPGFYARVLERIEAQRPVSIWNAFSESSFGRRVAMASIAVVVLLGTYLVASEPMQTHAAALNQPIQLLIGTQQTGLAFSTPGLPDRDAVLVNLVTYREQ